MQKLITGLHHFQSQIFLSHQELFERLAHEQTPDALFVTCSDSRINPNLITQTNPGDLFILRNAGNIIPSYGAANGGEGATIEFAVDGLGIKDIIVCGHSLCGAIDGLLHPEKVGHMPSVASWLNHAAAARRIALENYSNLSEDELLSVAIQENVLIQIENLRTHPSVAAKLSRGELNLHAWTYKIQTGEVFGFQPEEGQFLPVIEASNNKERRRSRSTDTISI
ncbi:MAG: carbonic anhydrase [Candidatus Obscuribacterales bacterium]|nr:carbonic anhydrase [Candidatus Obscuribacterales bacterium]